MKKNKREKKVEYSVYILEASDHTYYTGLTRNLKKRLELHNAGRGAKYLKGRRPAKLVYCETVKTIKSAMQRERAIKRLGRAKKAALAGRKKHDD